MLLTALQMQVTKAEKMIYIKANMKGQLEPDGVQLETAALG